MTEKEILRQYRDLARNIDSFSAGQASLVEGDDDDSMMMVRVAIVPNDGHYKGGRFVFELDLSCGYPLSAPSIRCLTNVYHPNIDLIDDYSNGDVCLNLLDEEFGPELTLEDYVQGLLFLFYNPNIEDPLSGAFDGSESEEEFHANVRKSMLGKEVDGMSFERLLPENYEGEDNEMTESEEEEKEEEEDQMKPTETATSSVTRDEATGQDLVTPAKGEANDTPPTHSISSKLKSTDGDAPPVTSGWYQTGLLIAMGVTVLASIGVMRLVQK